MDRESQEPSGCELLFLLPLWSLAFLRGPCLCFTFSKGLPPPADLKGEAAIELKC